MKNSKLTKSLFLFVAMAVLCPLANAQQMSELEAKRYERRAVEAAMWGMPVVNYWAMREGFARDLGSKANDIVYFSKPVDWHLRITTPNNTTLYMMSFWNTEKDGPIVIEVPKTTKDVGLFGTAMDAFQRPLVDFGNMGEDKGLGAKYLFLPIGYDKPIPDGYLPVYGNTNNEWFLLRVLLKNFSPESLAKGAAFAKSFKVYPYNNPGKKMNFHDAAGKDINAIAPYNDTFFDALNEVLQEERVAEQDMVAMGMLQTVGIEKGKVFNPTKDEREALDKAAKQMQQEFIDLVINNPDRYWNDRKWSYLAEPKVILETGFSYKYPRLLDYTARGTAYYSAFSSVVTYGTQTQYLVGGQDSDGNTLKGENNYVLHLPKDVPAAQFWSALVYDNNSAAFVKNTSKAGVSSLDKGLITNPDGSVDVYFGPKAPKGKEANWAPTVAGTDYFILFRFYGPKSSLVEKTWKMGDLIKQ